MWDLKTGKLIEKFDGHNDSVYSVSFSPDAKLLASGSLDKTLKLWDFKSGKCVRTFEGHGKAVRDCDLSPGFSIASRGGLATRDAAELERRGQLRVERDVREARGKVADAVHAAALQREAVEARGV